MEVICCTTDLHAGCGGGEGLDCGAVTHLPYHNITVSTQCLLSTHLSTHKYLQLSTQSHPLAAHPARVALGEAAGCHQAVAAPGAGQRGQDRGLEIIWKI